MGIRCCKPKKNRWDDWNESCNAANAEDCEGWDVQLDDADLEEQTGLAGEIFDNETPDTDTLWTIHGDYRSLLCRPEHLRWSFAQERETDTPKIKTALKRYDVTLTFD